MSFPESNPTMTGSEQGSDTPFGEEIKRQMDRMNRIAAGERAVLMRDSAKTLDFSRRLAEAGQRAAGLELGTPDSDDDEMIIGDVTINQSTNAPTTTEAAKNGMSDIAKMVAIAGASAMLGGAVPAGVIAANAIFGGDGSPAIIELEDTDTRNKIGIFRPEAQP